MALVFILFSVRGGERVYMYLTKYTASVRSFLHPVVSTEYPILYEHCPVEGGLLSFRPVLLCPVLAPELGQTAGAPKVEGVTPVNTS